MHNMACESTETWPNLVNTTTTEVDVDVDVVVVENETVASVSAEKIANNDDLLSEILVCLPIKALLKFKSVSKHWLSLISSPYFCSRCTPHSSAATGLFLLCNNVDEFMPWVYFIGLQDGNAQFFDNAGPLTSIPLLEDKRWDILHSCNGLYVFRNPVYHYVVNKTFYVVNPTTKQYTRLPLPKACTHDGFILNLAFDPSKSHYFKVICVIRRSDSPERPFYDIGIYSSEMPHWKPFGSSYEPFGISSEANGEAGTGVFWNGAVHWITEDKQSLLFFNVDEELLTKMALPLSPDRKPNMFWCHLGQSRDHLHVIDTFKHKPKVVVYEVKRDYSDMFVKFCVDLRMLLKEFPERERLVRVDCFVRGEVDEESFMVLRLPYESLVYYLKTATWKTISSRVAYFKYGCFYYLCPYIASLASI